MYACIYGEEMAPAPVFLPGESHGQKNLVGCSPWGRKESKTATEHMCARTHTHARTHTSFSFVSKKKKGS